MLDSCKKFNSQSQGYFEPTLFPLLKAWGFSFEQREQMDSAKVAALKAFVGFESKLVVTDSGYYAAEEGVKAMMQEVEKLLENPTVRKAYERFLFVAELTKEHNGKSTL
jgi:hypothetical protein